MASYVLGLDISTTGAKAVLVDQAGRLCASVTSEYPLATPRPLWSEQNPAHWWEGTVASVRGALAQSGVAARDICGIGLTGQMHGLVMLGAQGEVLRPAILWNDQRTGPQCETIRERIGLEALIAETGNRALPAFTAAKILWVREHEPEVYARCRQVLLPKDYMRFCLTGGYATDCSDASGTLLLNVRRRAWSQSVLSALEIPESWLPSLHEGTDVTGALSTAAAEATGLAAGTPVMGGGSDQAVQAVGVGVVEAAVGALTIGTSGVIFLPTADYVFDRQGLAHGFCHAVPGLWHIMASVQAAGGSLRWYRDAVAPGLTYPDLLAPAAQVTPGAGGLLFLPYLSGERTPHADPLARGGFLGFTLQHSQAHLTRAVLEGVAFGLRDNLLLLQEAGAAVAGELRMSGGGARSALWSQILADVLDTELATVNVLEGAAYGAALLAGVGVGVWPSVPQACKACIQVTGRVSPDPTRRAVYDSLYAVYRQVYPATRAIAHALAGVVAP